MFIQKGEFIQKGDNKQTASYWTTQWYTQTGGSKFSVTVQRQLLLNCKKISLLGKVVENYHISTYILYVLWSHFGHNQIIKFLFDSVFILDYCSHSQKWISCSALSLIFILYIHICIRKFNLLINPVCSGLQAPLRFSLCRSTLVSRRFTRYIAIQ